MRSALTLQKHTAKPRLSSGSYFSKFGLFTIRYWCTLIHIIMFDTIKRYVLADIAVCVLPGWSVFRDTGSYILWRRAVSAQIPQLLFFPPGKSLHGLLTFFCGLSVILHRLTPSVLHGFTCTSVHSMTEIRREGLIRACRPRVGMAKVQLKESQVHSSEIYLKLSLISKMHVVLLTINLYNNVYYSVFASFSTADLHVQPAQWKAHPELCRISRRHAPLLRVSLSPSILLYWSHNVPVCYFKKCTFSYWFSLLYVCLLQQQRCPDCQLQVILYRSGCCRLLCGLQHVEQGHAAAQRGHFLLGECH